MRSDMPTRGCFAFGLTKVGCRQVFDKGTLQSVLLMRGGMGLAHTLAQECWNVLKPGG